MRSVRTREFRRRFDSLPDGVRDTAQKSFELWKANTSHRSLLFKQVDPGEDIWSARVDRNYRALCTKNDDNGETLYVWFWIGPHHEYERLLG